MLLTGWIFDEDTEARSEGSVGPLWWAWGGLLGGWVQGLGSQMAEGSSRQRDHCDQRQEAQPHVGSTRNGAQL